MELIFLGTGTSQGVPLLAHTNPGLDLSNRRNHRTRASIHVVMDGVHIQVDAGPDFRAQCLANSIPAVDIFILTHEHSDHVIGMDDMRRYCDLRGGEAIPVYSTDAGLERIRNVFPYALRTHAGKTGYAAFDLHAMPPELTLSTGSIIRATPLPHGRALTLGLVFEEKSTGAKLAYYTDCKLVPLEAQALARNVDILVLDGLRPACHPTHQSIEEAVETAKRIGAKRNFITHTTNQVDYDTWAPHLAKDGVEIACDNTRIVF